ncbi:MAG: hypothetical protein Q8M16_03900, partial [Pirellulaceae bacterium]|nr:hypothetical protein [Pirellulaceae bacterium]
RITIVVEDDRLERFCREALMQLGYYRKEIRVRKSPPGKGSGKSWVTQQHVAEVKTLRSRNYQSLAVLIGSDVDELSLKERIAQLEESLRVSNLDERGTDERIAYWLPKWHIETWLMAFNGHEVTEMTDYKNQLSTVNFKNVGAAYVKHYRNRDDLGLPSLANTFAETVRIES